MTEEEDFERAQRKLENRCPGCGVEIIKPVLSLDQTMMSDCPDCLHRQNMALRRAFEELDADRSDRVLIVGAHTAKWFTK